MGKQSDLEKMAAEHVIMSGLPLPIREYSYQNGEKWRADLAWPDYKIIVEIHGGIWVQGRHVRGTGFRDDREKYNTAQINGWIVLEMCPNLITSKEWLVWARDALYSRGWHGPLLCTTTRAAHRRLVAATPRQPEQQSLFG